MTDPAQDDPQQWQQVQGLLAELLEHPAGERLALLDRKAVADAVKTRVRELLLALEQSPDYLEAGAERCAVESAPAAASLMPGTAIGAWRIERLLGRGGMGEVYLAARRDGAFEQQVAIKLIGVDAIAHMERFHAERRILAGLDHPGIARLLDGGVGPDRRPYMAMEYVDGQDIVSWCRDRRLDLPARLDLFIRVCEAVRYAHSRLVVHRDLKPRNIFVTASGEVKLLDFGVARLIETETGDDGGARTQPLLTPEYASPEQLEGEPVSLATDVYALGLLLFELLAGVSPWGRRDSTMPALVRRILDGDAPAPSRVAAQQIQPPVPAKLIRGDLDAIVLKALRREPERRYDSAAALCADVERHRQHQGVLARSGDAGYLLRRFLRRHWIVSAFTLALVLSIATGLIAALTYARQADRARLRAEQEADRSNAVMTYLTHMFREVSKDAPDDKAVSMRQVLEHGASELATAFENQPEEQAAVLGAIAAFYIQIGDHAAAAPLLEQQLQGIKDLPPDDRRATAQLLLATCQLYTNRWSEGERNIDDAIAYWSARGHRSDVDLLRAADIQSKLLWELGQHDRSIASLREVVALSRIVNGPDHFRTAGYMNSLAVRQLDSDGAQAALKTGADAWAIIERGGQQNTVMGLAVANGYAVVLREAGQLAEAEKLLRQTIATMRSLYGPSARMAALYSNLISTQLQQNRTREALASLDEVEALLKQGNVGMKPESEGAARLALSRARVHARLGEPGAARRSLDATRPVVLEHYPELSPLRMLLSAVDAEVLFAEGKMAEARAAMQTLADTYASGKAGTAPPDFEALRNKIIGG